MLCQASSGMLTSSLDRPVLGTLPDTGCVQVHGVCSCKALLVPGAAWALWLCSSWWTAQHVGS